MKLIKLDRRYHGYPEWTHALQFTRREVHPRYREQMPYVRAFSELYGPRTDEKVDPTTFTTVWLKNPDWEWSIHRRRIYFKDPKVMSFIELKIA